MIYYKKIIAGIAFLLAFNFLQAQDTLAPFYKDVQYFKKKDSVAFPPKDAVLFIGSSSFTKWQDAQEYFPTHTILNRAFGGSTLPDMIRYVNDIVFPYQPKQIVIYCGENDIASSDTITAATVFGRFRQLMELIRDSLPGVPVAYVSMKPSPSRQKFWPKMIEANSMIKKYLKKKKNTAFINVYPKMFNKDGTVMTDIFISDNLHMNAKGYVIWQKIMESYLK